MGSESQGLHLTNTAVSDAGLANLMGMTDLVALNLDGTQITDFGLASLKRLSKLIYLNFSKTQCTDDGADDLQLALPKTSIDR